MDLLHAAILRTLAYNAAWDYAPTKIQLVTSLDVGDQGLTERVSMADAVSAIEGLVQTGQITESRGHLALPAYATRIEEGREREIFFPRKLRRARQAAAFFKLLPWVRAVCLCNTTALGQAQDGGDLDFFVVVRAGAIWRSRFFSALPFKVLGARPGGSSGPDPICLSFFVADDALDLSSLMLEKDDPYFRHWYISLLPLYDDGVLAELWEANRPWLTTRHPLAVRWMALDSSHVARPTSQGVDGYGPGTIATVRPVRLRSASLRAGRATIAVSPSWLERQMKKIQWRNFPEAIRQMANTDTRVVATDSVLKFHVDDRRESFKEKYYAICRESGLEG